MSLPFSIADWLVIAAYVLLLLAGGWIFTPRNTGTAHDYFLAGGNVPAWLAARFSSVRIPAIAYI